jgi:hypothetical protein
MVMRGKHSCCWLWSFENCADGYVSAGVQGKKSSRWRKMTHLLILFEGMQDDVVLLSGRSWAEISLIR